MGPQRSWSDRAPAGRDATKTIREASERGDSGTTGGRIGVRARSLPERVKRVARQTEIRSEGDRNKFRVRGGPEEGKNEACEEWKRAMPNNNRQ
ncbi:hypothetical protein BDV59DRAFT_113213 [Aspergillus ambiguus]|uniref:uncharacterized protein n=1 Tax=Aspergillus ambiguus TaxID=176160 RepID=UPI003CCDC07A